MLTYLLFISFLIICAYLCQYCKQSDVVILYMLVVIFIFTAFRDTIGVDTPTYQEIFNALKEGHVDNLYWELGYLMINRIAIWLGGYFVIVQMLCVGICLVLIYQFLKEWLPYKLVGIGLLAFVCSMTYLSYMCSGVRQALAISICLFASRYIINRNFTKFCIAIGIAMLFHTSAIIFSPAYFIYKKKIKLSLIIVFFIASYVCAPFVKWSYDHLIGMVTGHYMGYAEMFNGDTNKNSGLGVIARIAVWIAVAILCHRALNPDNKMGNMFFNIYIVGICLYLINRNVSILNRLNDYYLTYFIWALPMSIYSFERRSKKVYFGLYALLLTGMFLSFVYFVKDSFIPYKSYLSLY